MVSDKVNQIAPSPTLKISAKAKSMKAEGIDVIDLSVGEPDFPTPENAKEAGIRAIRENFTRYTQNDGIPELKKAIIKRLKDDYGLEYAANEIIVSPGAKNSLYHLVQALVNDGDEVIVPAPYWVTYPECVRLAKGKPVVVQTREEDGFLLTPEDLRAAVTPATRALILNNPSNPTGSAYTREHLEALAQVIREEDIFVIADEIYDKLVYDGFRFTSFPTLGDDIRKKTVLINGVSKSYSMTGWRIGFAAGPAAVIGGMSKIQSHSTSNACSIAQKAAAEALAGPQHEVSRMASEFQRRRNYCLMKLRTIPGVSCFSPQGAFYLFPNMRACFDKEFNGSPIRNSYGLAYYLLREARTAIVPGDAFGADDYIRISYATSMENLEKGLDRIIEAMARLKPSKKVRRVALQNAATRTRKAVAVESPVDAPVRDSLLAEIESRAARENMFEWNANINGAVVRLRTNVPHLNDFWMENWYPAPLDDDLKPHGVITAVDGIPGREPRAFYHPETNTGILVNCDAYGPLRSLALGLVMDVGERMFGAHAVRGMSADIDGKGLVLIGPPGTKKTELFFELLRDERFRIHSNEAVFVRFANGEPAADAVERKLFIPTVSVESFDKLAPLFDSSKCENVVTRREDCRDDPCLRGEDCRLDRGSPYCYKASKDAHALLDPVWIGGPAGRVRKTILRWVFILKNDAVSPADVKLERDEALRILEAGETSGIAKSPEASKPQPPFFNPHLLVRTPDRIDQQKAFFRRLLETVDCRLFNSGTAGADRLREILS